MFALISDFSFLRISSLTSVVLSRRLSSGQDTRFLNHAYVSPKADCPASSPIIPGMIDPFTCPQIPRTSLLSISSVGATSMSQVDVPITLLRWYGSICPPTAPMCASKAPTPTTTSVVSPSRCAHSSEGLPAAWSDVYVSRNSREVNPLRSGSSDEKKSSGGSPPNSSAHSALWPAAHTPRFILWTSLPPVNTNGIQSQCSTQE